MEQEDQRATALDRAHAKAAARYEADGKNSTGRTTNHMGGDQIYHLRALEIFGKSLERVVELPKNEDSDREVGVASPLTSTNASITTCRRRFRILSCAVRQRKGSTIDSAPTVVPCGPLSVPHPHH